MQEEDAAPANSFFGSQLHELSLLGTTVGSTASTAALPLSATAEQSRLHLMSPLATPMPPPRSRPRRVSTTPSVAVNDAMDADPNAFAPVPVLQNSFSLGGRLGLTPTAATTRVSSFAALEASTTSSFSSSSASSSFATYGATPMRGRRTAAVRIATPMPKGVQLYASTSPSSRSLYWRRKLGVERWRPYASMSSAAMPPPRSATAVQFGRTWPLRRY